MHASGLRIGVSAHQLGQLPQIVVKVTPPQSKTVMLRLVRSEGSPDFPGGSETLSAREQGLAQLTWPASQGSVTTDGQGDGKLEIRSGQQAATRL